MGHSEVMYIAPVWERLGVPPETGSDQIVRELEHRVSLEPALRPYYQVFAVVTEAPLVRRLYDQLISDTVSMGRTQLKLDHPLVREVAMLAGVELRQDSPKWRGASEFMSPILDRFSTQTPTEPPSSPSAPPINVRERWVVVLSWAVLAVIGLGLLYAVPWVLEKWSARGRTTSAVADSVTSKLGDANRHLIDASNHLTALDASQSSLAQTSEPSWHDPNREPLPASLLARIAPPVRSEAELEAQDERILRYLAVVKARTRVLEEIEVVSRDLSRVAPDSKRGSEVEDLLRTEQLGAAAKRLSLEAKSLLSQLGSIRKEIAQ